MAIFSTMMVHINHLPRGIMMVHPFPQTFDGRWGAYDCTNNEWVSGEAVVEVEICLLRMHHYDHTHNNQPIYYQMSAIHGMTNE